MQSLRTVLGLAQANRVAIGHFNVSDLIFLKASFGAAHELNVPVVVGASKGEREFMGVRELASLVRLLRQDSDFPIFLNSDHTHSIEEAIEAAKAGFDLISFDGSSLPFEENIRKTREAVSTLKAINPEILVEGELGDIGSGSEIHASSSGIRNALTSAEEAKRFVDVTGVDLLAPSVGNAHGMTNTMVDGDDSKRLDVGRISEIKRATGVWLTLHGASGTHDDDLRGAIAAGVNMVHINTELRIAWRRALNEAFARDPEQVVPYKLLPAAGDAIKRVATARLKLFNKL